MSSEQYTKVVKYVRDDGVVDLIIWCPGCQTGHTFTSEWSFNNDYGCPSFSPSLWIDRPGGGICHSNVRDGRIRFDGESTHDLKNQDVELPDFPGFKMDVQTRSEETGLAYYPTLDDAQRAAESDPTIWKISYNEGARRVRLVRTADGWEDRPLMDEVQNLKGWSGEPQDGAGCH